VRGHFGNPEKVQFVAQKVRESKRRCGLGFSSVAGRPLHRRSETQLQTPFRRSIMAETKDKVKDKIDEAAEAAKNATDKVSDKAKEAAQKTGQAVQNAGKKIKDAGK
jgi:hypothetical protein